MAITTAAGLLAAPAEGAPPRSARQRFILIEDARFENLHGLVSQGLLEIRLDCLGVKSWRNSSSLTALRANVRKQNGQSFPLYPFIRWSTVRLDCHVALADRSVMSRAFFAGKLEHS